MDTTIIQYGVYWLRQDIVASGDKTITNDSQVVILEVKGDMVHVCRFSDYRESGWTNLKNLSKWKHK